ncbi:hypothetical protein B0H34DRAFT_679803 [Crassisporium funariophilum]|nr:hypothetical protein B0H34DRAFT_679803 [Crassisporium funariophilum]
MDCKQTATPALTNNGRKDCIGLNAEMAVEGTTATPSVKCDKCGEWVLKSLGYHNQTVHTTLVQIMHRTKTITVHQGSDGYFECPIPECGMKSRDSQALSKHTKRLCKEKAGENAKADTIDLTRCNIEAAEYVDRRGGENPVPESLTRSLSTLPSMFQQSQQVYKTPMEALTKYNESRSLGIGQRSNSGLSSGPVLVGALLRTSSRTGRREPVRLEAVLCIWTPGRNTIVKHKTFDLPALGIVINTLF